MSQFASTLYPQTNPTNPVLLEFREKRRLYSSHRSALLHYVSYLRGRTYVWSQVHEEHALRVLERLANLSG